MPEWLLSIFWYFAEKIGALLWKKVEDVEAQRESDQKTDQHAKDVTKEMQDAKSTEELDKADSDLLSGR